MADYTSLYFGVVYDAFTKEILSVINPDYDSQLEDASWVASPDRCLAMLKILKSDLGFGSGAINPPSAGPTIIEAATAILNGG